MSLRELPVDVDRFRFMAVTWEEVQDKTFTELPNFPGLTVQENYLLDLYYYQGLSHNQIAIRLRISKKAVKSRLSRVRDKLRNLFTNK